MKYEIVGLTRENANSIVTELWGGFISDGHAYLSDSCFLRPEGCKCDQCKALGKTSVTSNEGKS